MIKEWTPPVSRRIWCSTVPLTYWEWEEVRAGRWRIRLHHSWSKSICRTGGGLQSWQMAPRCFNGSEKKRYTLLPLWADTLFLHKATRTGEYMVTHLGSQVESNSGDIIILYPGEFPISLQHVSSGLWARKQVAKKKRNRQGGTGVARDKQMWLGNTWYGLVWSQYMDHSLSVKPVVS